MNIEIEQTYANDNSFQLTAENSYDLFDNDDSGVVDYLEIIKYFTNQNDAERNFTALVDHSEAFEDMNRTFYETIEWEFFGQTRENNDFTFVDPDELFDGMDRNVEDNSEGAHVTYRNFMDYLEHGYPYQDSTRQNLTLT